MRSIIFTFAFLLSTGLWIPGIAQNFYPGNYFYGVAEDGQSFFFQPSEFSPLQTGAFNEVAISVSDHPLSAINRNPANMNLFPSNGYAYLDVKTLPEESVTRYYGCETCFMNQLAYLYTPEPTPKKTQEPFMSVALFLNPFENERFSVGFTYQYMNINESYYNRIGYPYGFYRPGLFSTDSQNQFFGEEDYFNKYGHFPALYTGYALSENLSVGLKVSYNSYRGNGTMVSEDFGQMTDIAYPQTNMFDRNRDIDYGHWDFSSGINFQLTNTMDAGITAGFLTGDFEQAGREQYLQNFLNDEHPNYEDYYYRYDSNFSQRDGFNRSGQMVYASAEYNWQQRESRSFRFLYQGSRTLQDFEYGLTSTSLGNVESQTFQSSDGEIFRISEEDQRTNTDGMGELTKWHNEGGVFMIQDLSSGFQLRAGVQVLYMNTEETALEQHQDTYKEDRFERIENGPLTERRVRSEHSREMDITQNFYEFTGYIPLIVRKSFGDQFFGEAGVLGTRQRVIRKFDQYHKYENEYVTTEDGVSETDESQNDHATGERISDLRTYFNAYGSLVFSPYNHFKLRVMTFSDRRQLNSVSSMDALRFRISAEFNF